MIFTDKEALHAVRWELNVAEAELDEAKGKRWPDVGLSGHIPGQCHP